MVLPSFVMTPIRSTNRSGLALYPSFNHYNSRKFVSIKFFCILPSYFQLPLLFHIQSYIFYFLTNTFDYLISLVLSSLPVFFIFDSNYITKDSCWIQKGHTRTSIIFHCFTVIVLSVICYLRCVYLPILNVHSSSCILPSAYFLNLFPNTFAHIFKITDGRHITFLFTHSVDFLFLCIVTTMMFLSKHLYLFLFIYYLTLFSQE